MHSNGGCGLVPEARSPVRGESRRAGHPAAPARRRSCGARELIAGACVEQLRTTSAIGFPRLLFICYDRVLSVGPRSVGAQRTPGGRVGLLRRLNEVLTNGPNENRVSIVFSVEKKSGMERIQPRSHIFRFAPDGGHSGVARAAVCLCTKRTCRPLAGISALSRRTDMASTGRDFRF